MNNLKKFLFLLVLLLAACQPEPNTTASPLPIPTFQLNTPTSYAATETSAPPALSTMTPTSIPTIPASVVELSGAEVPPGFSLIKYADVAHPTAFVFDSQGRMYVASQDGDIYLLRDNDKDGRADSQTVFSAGYKIPLGVAVRTATGEIFVSQRGEITILKDTNGDDFADQQRTLVKELPFGKHQNDNLEFGPDGWLYVGIGSACDACQDPDPRSASIMRFNVDTGASEIFATGLRNPYDLAFQPETGQLFATDNGRDDLGLDAPSEELNNITQGGDYGYPDCWDRQDGPGCENTIPAIAFFEAHSSADGLDFYNGKKFPSEYRGNAFVSIFGSGLKDVQTGIQRVMVTLSGDTFTFVGETSWFVRFPKGVTPLPLVSGPDDALYVGDYVGGAIYRISYGLP